MKSRLLLLLVAICISAPAVAEPYWIAWEGDDFPENQGWERHWGNWDGPYEGDGAIRTLNDGVMTIDSLYDDGVYDYCQIERPGELDPGPGELFVLEWRIEVEEVVGWTFDPTVGVDSDNGWTLGLEIGTDRVVSIDEGYAEIPIAPGVPHDYRVVTADMQSYDLYVDEALAHQGTFVQWISPSRVHWGDGWQGVASLHHWEYFRFGVVPEPRSSGLAVASLIACAVGRRGRILRRY